MKIDILAFGAHPDDIELSCGGTLIKEIQNGKSVVLIDLTKGELGTRGTAETRKVEAAKAADILGVSLRENMNFSDGFLVNDKACGDLLDRSLAHFLVSLVNSSNSTTLLAIPILKQSVEDIFFASIAYSKARA